VKNLASASARLQQDKTNVRGIKLGLHTPIEEIVPQLAVPRTKLEALKERFILQDVQGVEDVVLPAQHCLGYFVSKLQL